MGKIKFEFGLDFQELILQYTVTDKKGYKIIELYDDSYFTLIHHAVIAYCLKKYYKKKKRVPEEPMLKETLRVLFHSNKDMILSLNDEDRDKIDKTISRIYSRQVGDSQTIVEKCINFARYVKFKEELEKVDINQYDSYEASLNRLRAANNIGSTVQEDFGIFVVDGMKDRAYKRDQVLPITATPFWQFNQLLNSGGLTKGSVVLIAAQAKRFKTGFLLNVGKYLMRRKKRVIYFDFENGQQALTTRTEQSILGMDQLSISSGDMDERLLKIFRKYKRLGSEMLIKRMPAYKATTDNCQAFLEKIKQDFGLTFTDCIFDFPDLMNPTSGIKDDTQRISDTYVDIKNFAEFNNFDSVWVPSHVTREAGKRRGTKYTQNDLAKCIDKIRHVDCALGLQESEDEIAQGVMRLEVIDQRNGMHTGSMLFWVDLEKQQMVEFNKKEVNEYKKQIESHKPEKQSDL